MTTKAPETTPDAVDAIRANVMTLATLDAIWVPIDDYAAVVAERDALREALNVIDALDPEECVYLCHDDALRGLVLRMGEIARAALAKQEPKE